jgi:predicted TIM-barrel fold metal-dependent hydrolase
MSNPKTAGPPEPKEFREDDTWFSDDQLGQLAPADQADALHAPIPTQMVSNGEYMPIAQTVKQKRVEARMLEIADAAARKLGTSRRSFLKTSGGMAAGFLAMNEVFGNFFDVHVDELFMSKASAATGGRGAPPNLFVFDDQLHIIRSSRTGPGNALRDIAAGNPNAFNRLNLPDELNGINTPWNPAVVGLPNVNANFHLGQFMKDVYLDSQVTVGIMTNNNSAAVPTEGGPSRPPKNVAESEANEFLTARQTMATRDWVNRIAGSTRMLGHGQLYTGVGNLWFIQQQIDELHPDSWKGYTVATAAKVDNDPNSDMKRWRLDDEAVAYPTYELIAKNRRELKKHPGFFNLCIHKGLNTTAGPIAELGHPSDIPKAARDWPEFNFIIYHACFRPSFWALSALEEVRSGAMRAGVPDISWTTEFCELAAPYPNVQAEIGTTFASTVITFPTVCAHILGQLLKFFGEDRVVFGSDGVWYGSPQWQIEAFWRFQIPDELCRQYGYPKLTESIKRKVLGLNSARNYRLPPASAPGGGPYKPVPQNYESLMTLELKTILEFSGYVADNFSKAKETYLASGGLPDHTRYGWLRRRG